MNVTHETILVTLVRKDARIATLEVELAAVQARLAEAERDRDAARMEADNLLALAKADEGERDTELLERAG